jgi:hypothetical protein
MLRFLHKQTINQRWCIIVNSLKNEIEVVDLEFINDDLANTKTELFCALCEKMKHSMLHISIKLLRLPFIFSHNAQIHVSHSNRDKGKVQFRFSNKNRIFSIVTIYPLDY